MLVGSPSMALRACSSVACNIGAHGASSVITRGSSVCRSSRSSARRVIRSFERRTVSRLIAASHARLLISSHDRARSCTRARVCTAIRLSMRAQQRRLTAHRSAGMIVNANSASAVINSIASASWHVCNYNLINSIDAVCLLFASAKCKA